MRIANTGLPETAGAAASTPVAPIQEAPETTSAGAANMSAPGALQSAALAPARTALNEMPEIDQAKVAAVRDALAKGEIAFDAGKLAGLIARYHAGQ